MLAHCVSYLDNGFYVTIAYFYIANLQCIFDSLTAQCPCIIHIGRITWVQYCIF